MSTNEQKNDLIAQFILINPVEEDKARFYLESSNWDLNVALSSCYDEIENPESTGAPRASGSASSPRNLEKKAGSDDDYDYQEGSESEESESAMEEAQARVTRSTGNNTFGAQRGYKTRSRIATLDFEEEEKSDNEVDFYTGGEKSGMAVRAPKSEREANANLIEKILKKAAEGGSSLEPEQTLNSSGAFKGKGLYHANFVIDPTPIGRTLVNDTPTEQDHNSQETDSEPVIRNLTIWRNGFSMDDGPLHSNDDPNTQEYLRSILAGYAPTHLLNIRPGQHVELRVQQRNNEDYTPPPKKFVPFEGRGRRLGEVTPSVVGVSSSTQPATTGISQSADSEPIQVDEGLPFTKIQVRLCDGSRFTLRLNHLHTVADIRRAIDM
ncbi:UBX domain-containing protein 3 [Zancudomyces culisetae]|uniref:UBX domain-containing protein 3 n=1 Tax=Zancudomyces culisetae TaxID=1213189 RepID=A0A1R1PX72_ZANCU|nr:UBX domain-containing protein 3 [Zancudomyces culisetae]|eukprot:OMH85534.1 UBX domain-containing protein 3 [Zancudomyces culisetae]